MLKIIGIKVCYYLIKIFLHNKIHFKINTVDSHYSELLCPVIATIRSGKMRDSVPIARDILPFVMYCVNGKPRSSLLIESTDSMIRYNQLMYNKVLSINL